MNEKDLYLSWLKDAHSTEKSLIPTLQNHADDAKDYPELRQALLQHMEQTRQHADLIEGCIKRLGDSPSALKTGITSFTGTVKNALNSAAGDEVVKNTLDDYVAENLEIASYTSVIAAAEAQNDMETAQVCRQILAQEEQAAALVKAQVPIVTLGAMRSKAGASR